MLMLCYKLALAPCSDRQLDASLKGRAGRSWGILGFMVVMITVLTGPVVQTQSRSVGVEQGWKLGTG